VPRRTNLEQSRWHYKDGARRTETCHHRVFGGSRAEEDDNEDENESRRSTRKPIGRCSRGQRYTYRSGVMSSTVLKMKTDAHILSVVGVQAIPEYKLSEWHDPNYKEEDDDELASR
jgi:hypothetical protein